MAKEKKSGDSNEKLMAVISYISIIGLIILFIEKKSKFVLHHAKQGTALFALELAVMILANIPIVNAITPLLSLAVFVVAIYGIILALQNSETKIPYAYDLGEKIAELIAPKK
jgi:uncharacterized membrane protein